MKKKYTFLILLFVCFFLLMPLNNAGPVMAVNVASPTNIVTVRFYAQGGTPVSDMQVRAGDRLPYVPVSSRGGFIFQGWYTQVGGIGSVLTNSTPILTDMSYYAHWADSRRILTGIRAIYKGSASAHAGDYVNAGLEVTAFYADGSNELIHTYQTSQQFLQQGSNTILVSYGGYSQTVHVMASARAKNVVRVTAEFLGGQVPVGPFQAEGSLHVTAYYSDGTSELVYGYTLSNSYITKGANAITAYYAGRSAVFTVIGYQDNIVQFPNVPNMAAQTVSFGSSLTKVLDGFIPAKKGFVFNGWYLDADCTKSVPADMAVVADMPVYAKWTEFYDWTLNKKKVSIKKGKTASLYVEGADRGTVRWKSSNTKIAEVNNLGKVKAKKVGTANITAVTADGTVLTCRVTVKK